MRINIKQLRNIIKESLNEYYDDDFTKQVYGDTYSKQDLENIAKKDKLSYGDLLKNKHTDDYFKDDTKANKIDSMLKMLLPILKNFTLESESNKTETTLYYKFEKDIEEKSYMILITFVFKTNGKIDIVVSFDYFNEEDDNIESISKDLEEMDLDFHNVDEKNLKMVLVNINKKINEFQQMF